MFIYSTTQLTNCLNLFFLLTGDTHGDYSRYPLPQCHLNDNSPGPWGQNEYYLHPQPQPALNDAPWIQNEFSFGGIILYF